MSIEIPLTKGLIAIVDDEWHWLDTWKWYAQKCGNKYYARHKERYPEGMKIISMHRLIMNAKPGQKIDHINGNSCDNRVDNMRFCTDSQNFQNSRKRKGCSSKYKGVFKSGRKWRSQICIPGTSKSMSIGNFETEKEAALAYDEKAKELFGEFARLNFVDNKVNSLLLV